QRPGLTRVRIERSALQGRSPRTAKLAAEVVGSDLTVPCGAVGSREGGECCRRRWRRAAQRLASLAAAAAATITVTAARARSPLLWSRRRIRRSCPSLAVL